ncbi:MAG: ROK family protein [Coriobacteriales bacterium]|nr:ROK family protein [Coriobacteriales bacterium]
MNRVGIDIGGTQLRVALFSEANEILRREAIANDHELGPRENLDKLVDILEGWGLPYEGIGVGCPGPLDFAAGKVLNPPNLPGWENFEIVRYLSERTGCKVLVNNDANVAGLAEARVGAAAGLESVFFFTVSTGVGGAYIYRGEIVGGANSCAAEMFNMMVSEDKFCRPGMNPGGLEDHASGTALARMATERFGRETDARELFALAETGNKEAQDILESAADALARAVSNVCFVVDPNRFVFGGSVALHNPAFIDAVYKLAQGYVLNPDKLDFALAECGDDAGLIGASLLV